jgi:hypothetical protein
VTPRPPHPGPPEVREARELLARTPALLDGWLRGLSEPWLSATEGEGTYSPRDVVAHLADDEAVDWLPRLRIVLEHGEALPFTPFEREGFRARFADLGIGGLLDEFAARRRENLAALDAMALSPADLDRSGTHPALGRVTVRQLLAGWTVHDLTHIAQLARVLAKRYAGAVGPWHAYLGVLSDRPRSGGS